MDRHPLDHLVASDRSYEVFQKQRRDGELPSSYLHSPYRVREGVAKFFSIPNDVVVSHPESGAITTVSGFRNER